MKRILLIISAFIMSIDFVKADPGITQKELDNAFRISDNMIKKYYSVLSKLIITPEERTSSNIIEKTSTYFRPKEAYEIFYTNDIVKLESRTIDNFERYSGAICEDLYLPVAQATLNPKILQHSNVAYDSVHNLFYFYSSVMLYSTTINEQTEKKVNNDSANVYFYISFNPTTDIEKNIVLKFEGTRAPNEKMFKNIKPAKILTEQAIAKKISKDLKSYVSFNVTPLDANLKIDGKSVFYTNGEPLALSPGTHKIKISRQGFKAIEKEVEFKEGVSSAVTERLAERSGYLTVTDRSMSGATVWVDEIKVGTVPLSDYKLQTGDHKITISQRDYVRRSSVVTVYEDEVTYFDPPELMSLEKAQEIGLYTANGVVVAITAFNILKSAPEVIDIINIFTHGLPFGGGELPIPRPFGGSGGIKIPRFRLPGR